MEPAIDRGGTQISHQPEINSCHSVQPLRETTAATSFQLRQESYIIVSIESASRESALEEQREKNREERRGSQKPKEGRNGSSPTHAYLYAFSNHHRNGLHQMQRADEARIDRAAGRSVQPRHISLQRMRRGRELPEGDLTSIVFSRRAAFEARLRFVPDVGASKAFENRTAF
jgi:hypothetical protein